MTRVFKYDTAGTCSEKITLQIDGEIIKSVEFEDGCEGNLTAIGRLVVNMKIDDVIRMFKGIDCEGRGTSCPDQLAKALTHYKKEK